MSVYDPEKVLAERVALDHLRQQERASMPLWERLRRASDKAKLLSTVPSAGISEYTTRGKAETREPPAQQPFDASPYLTRIGNALEDLERELEAHLGVGVSQNYTTMLGETKDKELVDRWQGIPSTRVAREAPHFGRTARTIERARQREAARRGLLINAKTGQLLGKDLRDAA